MKVITVSFLSLCFLILLGGCATVGNEFDSAAIDKLKAGRTTEAQAIALLGSRPTHRQSRLMNSPNPESWVKGGYFLGWKYAVGNMFGNGKGESVILMFDQNKVLKEIVAQSSVNVDVN